MQIKWLDNVMKMLEKATVIESRKNAHRIAKPRKEANIFI